MISFLKKWHLSVVTLACSLVGFLTPSVQAFAASHKLYAAGILAVWGVILHAAQSPRAK